MVKALATKNVVAVLTAVAMLVGISFAFATPAKADTISTLQAQVQALLAQIQALQGSTTTTTTGTTSTSAGCYTFTQNLKLNSTGGQVMWVQQFLNNHGFTVAKTGAGSPGNETTHFGPATKAAVIAFQNAYASAVLTPAGLTKGNGNWYAGTRAQANALCAGSTTGTTTGGGTTTPTGPGITVTAGTQPANSLAPMEATRVPFTTFTIANNTSAAVTINGVTVQRTGLANDNAFAGVILVDSTGMQYGNSQTFNSNHQATIGGTFTLQAGQSMTYTVAGNMELTNTGNNAGQVASIAVVGVNTTVPVSGTLPITGASQTINETLTIGTAQVTNSGFDPGSARSESLGTTALTFSAVHIQVNNEDQKLFSITWNQTGSVGSTDLGNLVTVVNGSKYPVTVDSSGKYFTSTFPGGILIAKGNSLDASIQGDLVGSNASNRTVEFDIYRASDIYLVGQTYGYGVSPSTTGTATNHVGNNTQSGFNGSTNPFFFGATMTITPGTLSTVSTASSIAPQNIGVNVPNQTLGGFSTNFTGEPVTVQSIPVTVVDSSSTLATQLQNVTLVDSNGNVVAGPVDETSISGTTGTIAFNSSVTFPVGSMTYTIKGTVATGAQNGVTYTLSTNPKNWTGAVGQNSGSYVSLTDTTLTMSTMTIQPAAINISASASPAGTTVSVNQNNYAIANIVIDATQSGEDVRLNALPVVVYATSSAIATELKNNLTGCQLFNGSTALNNNSIGSGQWGPITNTGAGGGAFSASNGVEANFVFENSLTVPKSTTVTLTLQCNVGGGFTGGEGFAAGVSGNYLPTVTGATSGNSVTGTSLVVSSNSSGTMTIGNPTMAITVPTPLSYSQFAGGTTGVTVGTFTLQPTSGAVNLTQLNLELNSTSASPSDFNNGVVSIWNGSTQVGSVNFSGVTVSGGFYTKLAYLSGVTIPQNVQTTLTLKADLAPINNGSGTGRSGDEIKLSVVNAQGTSGNTQVNSGAGPVTSTGVATFASTPSVALVSLPSTGVSTDGKLLEFTITTNSSGPVGLGKLTFQITPGTGVTVTNPQLFAYTGADLGTAAGGTNNGMVTSNGTLSALPTGVITASGSTTATQLGTPLQIPANTTWYFVLKGQTAYSGGNATWSVGATLNTDTTDLAPTMYMLSGLSGSNFVWSPDSKTNSAFAATDWTSGFGVSGLSSGISQSRQN
jgi:hypothetical protein